MKKVVYQIYISSFKDASGNGRGDLRGIIQKLDYLQNLGIDYIWITPFFQSPLKDNGYDISDYLKIDPQFGTFEDLKELIKVAKTKEIKVMLDMVFNHTSTAHKWFKKWINHDPAYKDYYISKSSKGQPPTNWVSKFGGSAWKEYAENQWYLHLFDQSQADLNWENPKVRAELFQTIDFYIKLGIKGFRFDVINLISKSKIEDDFEGDGRSKYTNGPRVHEFVEMLAQKFPKSVDFLTVGELSSTDIKNSIQFANKNKTELDSVFTFHHLKVDYDGLNKFVAIKPDLKKLNDIFAEWFTKINKAGAKMATFLTNHDQPRSVSRFIDRKYRNVGAKMLFALTASLPGIPYIYQGEEIAMENADFTNKNDFRDVESLNFLKQQQGNKIPLGLKQKSRDNSRTPMQWNDQLHAGFTNGNPWIKVNDNYKRINVKTELENKDSVLNFYKDYIKFIKNDLVQTEGDIVFHKFQNNVITYTRSYKATKYKHIFSFNNKKIKLTFNKEKIIKSNYQETESNILKPYQFIVTEQ